MRLTRRYLFGLLATVPIIGGHFNGIKEGTPFEAPLDQKFYNEWIIQLPTEVKFEQKPRALDEIFSSIPESNCVYFRTDTPVRLVLDGKFCRFEVMGNE